jgi:hypothetical protein
MRRDAISPQLRWGYRRVGVRALHGSKRPCELPGCFEPTVGRGMCKMHYMRWYRHRTTNALISYTRPRRAMSCVAVDCEATPVGRGLCRRHYDLLRRARRTAS